MSATSATKVPMATPEPIASITGRTQVNANAGHQQRDAAPLGVADLARPLRNGLLGGDVVGAGAVSFREVSMNHDDEQQKRGVGGGQAHGQRTSFFMGKVAG